MGLTSSPGLTERAPWLRALNISERLERNRAHAETGVELDLELAAGRLARWRAQTTLSGDHLDPAMLHGCTESDLRKVLGEALHSSADGSCPPRDPKLSEWWDELESIHEGSGDLAGPRSSFANEHPVLIAVERPIQLAQETLRLSTNRVLKRYPEAPFDSESISDIMFVSIKRSLALLVEQCFVLEMHAARMQDKLSGKTSQRRYDEYLATFGDPATCLKFLCEYPVLARLVVRTLTNWVAVSEEFIERLAQDWATIRAKFRLSSERDRLTSYEVLGDPHCGGRRVSGCVFASGFRLIYKPRPVQCERHFQNLLKWVNQRSHIPPLRTLKVLDQRSYGWVEFVEAGHCESLEQLHRFYERQGAYLALLHILAAHDLHYENVIASGEHPVLVDLETILQPTSASHDQGLGPAERVAAELTAESVLRIGLLPIRPVARGDQDGPDMSGLGAVPNQPAPVRIPRWADAGTDAMHQVLGEGNLGDAHSRPIPPESGLTVGDFVEDVVHGFETTFDLLYRERDLLLAPSGPISIFATDETRRIVRPTLMYAMSLRAGYHPQLLSDGLSRELQFDRLLGAELSQAQPYPFGVMAAERDDLWHLDIPRFSARPDSRHLWTSSGSRISDCLAETGLESAERRIARMSAPERSLQSWMIRTSIATRSLTGPNGDRDLYLVDVERPALSTADGLLDTAVQVGDRLSRHALTAEGASTWIGLVSQRGERWWISPLGPDLYEGVAGIALFLAHLGLVADEKHYVELARGALRTLREQVARDGFRESIGGFAGYGGHVYVMSRLAALLDDASLLSDADMAIRAISSLIDQDTGIDVIAGSAGCIGALLSSYRARPTEETLAAALQCGEKLLASSVETQQGLAWHLDAVSSRPLGGFAHGTAGMSWALLELASATSETRFRDAAIEAIRYDRSLFSPKARNWLDVRDDVASARLSVGTDEGTCLAHWCHGAGGIGLSRIRCQRHWDDGAVREEIEDALKATIAHGFGSNHCLCHGDFGNLELLAEAQRAFPESRWGSEFARVSSDVLASIEERGCITGHVLGLESPGLMLGIAGIGYGMLRIVAPERVPSVLLLDGPNA